ADGETLNTTADSEVIARLLVKNMHLGPEEAVSATMARLRGAYSVAVLMPNLGIGFRDPNGVRPVVAGTVGDGFMVASESCALWPVGGNAERGVKPGEAVLIDAKGMRFSQVAEPKAESVCMFEFIYFARPDSVMYDRELYAVREE